MVHGGTKGHILAAYDVQIAKKFAKKSEIVWKKDWLQNSGEQMCNDIKRLSGKDDAVIGVLSTLSLGDYDVLRGWLKKHLPKTKIFRTPKKIDGIFSELRKTKTAKEIKFLKQSCSIASDTVPLIGEFIANNPGLKERDVAVFIDTSMILL